MKAKEKIAALQALMKKEGIDGYLIPSSDPHMSEYLPDHYAARSWFSGFNGSAGTLAVTSEKAALWADGLFYPGRASAGGKRHRAYEDRRARRSYCGKMAG